MLEPFLRRLNRYGPPSAEERAALIEILTPPAAIPAGHEIIRQFSQPRNSTLLISGTVGRLVTLKRGAQQITALQVPGDFVDLHAFLLGNLDHSIVALSECLIATVAHDDLRQITNRYPRLGRSLWFLTLVDAAIHRQWLAVLGRREAVARVAHVLCELYVRIKDVGLADDNRFELGLTQVQMADVLGLSAVHINRVAQALRRRGLVSWDRHGHVQIRDWAALEELAEFDPAYLQLEGRREP
ncbi:Crp/Fnr family transcriptional regulator [Phenylobacterium sp.]|jgi:CRP-like cAMP-binding protein|uniref:Crp/Fnr family transcriptional regulator n=1 Tax=Phenylobacterium sp. TaxID=1871053 RepID=UPI002F404F84